MGLKHTDIWRAIDALAAKEGLSPSGLAQKAGLSPTAFNPSKRISTKRKHWPSTESIAQILEATHTKLADFVEFLTSDILDERSTLPLISLSEAGREDLYDESGHPSGHFWDRVPFGSLPDPYAFALEVTGKNLEPIYREGDRLILSPAEKLRRGDRVVACNRKWEIRVGVLVYDGLQKIDLVTFNSDAASVTWARSEIVWIYRIIWVSQ